MRLDRERQGFRQLSSTKGLQVLDVGRLPKRCCFAWLANKLGFRSDQIQNVLQKDSNRDIAHQLFPTAGGPGRFRHHNLEGCVSGVTKLMESAPAIHDDGNADEGSTEDHVRSPNQTGISNLPDQARDRQYIFLDKLHADLARGPRATVTSLFIQRSTYFVLWMKPISKTVWRASDVQRLSRKSG